MVTYFDKFGNSEARKIETGVAIAHVYALALDDAAEQVAISIGPEIQIAQRFANSGYGTTSIMPKPKKIFPANPTSDSRVRGRSLAFIENGRRLVVAYLNHGIICWDVKTSTSLWHIEPMHANRHIAALSPDCRSLLVSNLNTGADLYSLKSLDIVHSYHYNVNPHTNFPLSVAFLKKGKYVTCGTHNNDVSIWNAATAEVFQTLQHQDPLITCLAVHSVNGHEYIATATTSDEVEIKIWKAPLDNTTVERITEGWRRHFSSRMADVRESKFIRDSILITTVAIMTFLFTRYTQASSSIVLPASHGKGTVSAAVKKPDSMEHSHILGLLLNALAAMWRRLVASISSVLQGWWVSMMDWLRHRVLEWLDIERPVVSNPSTDSGVPTIIYL